MENSQSSTTTIEPPEAATDLPTKPVDRIPSWVLLTRIFIGLGWIRAFAHKIADPQWWSGESIEEFVLAHQDITLGWYTPFLDNAVLPMVSVIALLVVLGQAVAGLTLLTGRLLGIGLTVGMVLNLNFMAAGAANPSAFYLLAQGSLALWLFDQNESLTVKATTKARAVAVVATLLAVASLPFISTIHPNSVTDDPAMMIVFGGGLAALACLHAAQGSLRGTEHSAVSESEQPAVSESGQLPTPDESEQSAALRHHRRPILIPIRMRLTRYLFVVLNQRVNRFVANIGRWRSQLHKSVERKIRPRARIGDVEDHPRVPSHIDRLGPVSGNRNDERPVRSAICMS